MSRDKQIEEMAEIIGKNTEQDTMWPEIYSSAEALYNAGYRKSSELVRCKDCKFNVANMEIDENDGTDYSGKDIVCSYFMTDGMEKNDYCSRGERRDENGME